MKKTTIALLVIAACLGTACSNKTSDEKPSNDVQTDKPAAGDAQAPQAADADKAADDKAGDTKIANAPVVDPNDPGVECTERMCQCGSSVCARNEVCKGGQCYCGDQLANNEDYQCKDVNVAVIPSPNEVIERQYVCQAAEGCVCEGAVGSTKCPQNSYCIDGGGCGCGNTKLSPDDADIDGYACNLVSDNQYDWVCRESNGCRCGSITAAVNMGCNGKNATCLGSPVPGRGLACRPKAYNNYKYHLACFKDECECYGKMITKDEVCEPLECPDNYIRGPKGCMCGSEVLADGFECVAGKGGKAVHYCTESGDAKCSCGESNCAEYEVCKRGECVDRIAMKKQEDRDNYEFVDGFWKCTNPDGCTCGKPAKNGKPNCVTGKYCINGSCRKDRYFRTVDGKALYYKFNENTDVTDASFHSLWNLIFIDENEPICQNGYTEIYQNVDGKQVEFCYDEQYKNMTVAEFMKNCGVGPQPEKVSDLYCEIDVMNGSLGHIQSQYKISVSGWKE